MVWMGLVLVVIITLGGGLWFILVRRPVRVEALGSVSPHWIAEHAADS